MGLGGLSPSADVDVVYPLQRTVEGSGHLSLAGKLIRSEVGDCSPPTFASASGFARAFEPPANPMGLGEQPPHTNSLQDYLSGRPK